MKRAETEFRNGEKICTKVYYNDVKLQFIKCELSHLYLIKKNYPLAYQYLFDTLPVNRNLYGDRSIEVLANHIELACLAGECIESLTNAGFSVKQTSQKLFRQLIRMTSRASTNKQKQQQRKDADVFAFEELDRKLSNCELLKWKLIFKRHYQAIEQLYATISKRDAKIACDESVASLNKLAHLKKFFQSIES